MTPEARKEPETVILRREDWERLQGLLGVFIATCEAGNHIDPDDAAKAREALTIQPLSVPGRGEEREMWREGFIGRILCGCDDAKNYDHARNAELHGCGKQMLFKDAYRCYECDYWFHKECLKKHFDKCSSLSEGSQA